jgi:glycosyltransferase involved in cell wall biosynthesis
MTSPLPKKDRAGSPRRVQAALVVDEFPLPPRNGVTIPTSQFLAWMIQRGYAIDLFVLSGELTVPADMQLDSVRIIHIPRRATRSRKRLTGEIFSGLASFANWIYDPPPVDHSAKEYDLVLCSPISALDFPLHHGLRTRHLSAAINDVYTAVLKTYPFGSLAARLANRLRAWRMGTTEAGMLMQCHSVLVQTPADKNWIHRIGGQELAARCHAIHNAANEDLISALPLAKAPPPRVLFIADLSNALYQKNLDWLYDCWQQAAKSVPQARLRIVGRGLEANLALYARLKADPSVELPGFVKNLLDAYLDVRVVAAPIFKSYGFMNKVAEAAAMGLPVVGDLSAFNGMSKLLEMGGSLAADNKPDFSAALTKLLQDDTFWQGQAQNAKTFAQQELTTAALHRKLDTVFGSVGNASNIRHVGSEAT